MPPRPPSTRARFLRSIINLLPYELAGFIRRFRRRKFLIPNPNEYFRDLLPPGSPQQRELEQEARVEFVPIIGPMMGKMLMILVQTMQAKNVLELGTATGYSGLFLAEGCSKTGGKLVTLEIDPKMAERAMANFRTAGLDQYVEIRLGDALQELKKLEGPFDLVFMDIEKDDYFRALADCQRLLRPGGLLVVDNVSFKEADNFNRAVADSPEWTTVNLYSFLPFHSPEQDGICLALRN